MHVVEGVVLLRWHGLEAFEVGVVELRPLVGVFVSDMLRVALRYLADVGHVFHHAIVTGRVQYDPYVPGGALHDGPVVGGIVTNGEACGLHGPSVEFHYAVERHPEDLAEWNGLVVDVLGLYRDELDVLVESAEGEEFVAGLVVEAHGELD